MSKQQAIIGKMTVAKGEVVILRTIGGEEIIGKVVGGVESENPNIAGYYAGRDGQVGPHIRLDTGSIILEDARSFMSGQDNRLGLVYSMISVRTDRVILNTNTCLMIVTGDEVPEAIRRVYIAEVTGMDLPPTKELILS